MRKTSVIIILLLGTMIVVTGCGVTVSCPTCEPTCSTCQPQQCWLEVASVSSDVWGYVWVEGSNSGVYLNCFSSVRLSVPCNRELVVQIVDQYGVGSHWEYVYTTIETARVTYYYW